MSSNRRYNTSWDEDTSDWGWILAPTKHELVKDFINAARKEQQAQALRDRQFKMEKASQKYRSRLEK